MSSIRRPVSYTHLDVYKRQIRKKPKALVPALRRIGRCGETAMYAATKGVNTHKGMVFSMGILCCALGLLTAESQEEEALSLIHI